MKNIQRNWRSLVVLSGFVAVVSQAEVFAGTNCSADINGENEGPDGVVDALDLALVLNEFGASKSVADINGDGVVNASDLAEVSSQWGACPAQCPEDFDSDGVVGESDLKFLTSEWTYGPSASKSIADLNKDGAVGALDLSILLAAFGKNCQATESDSTEDSEERAETQVHRLNGPYTFK